MKARNSKGSNLFELYSEDMEETMTDKESPEKAPEPKPLAPVIDDNKEFPDSAEIITDFLEGKKTTVTPSSKTHEQKVEPFETLQEQRKSAVNYIQRPASSSTLNKEPLRVKATEIITETPTESENISSERTVETGKSFMVPVIFATFAGMAILEYFTYLFWALSPSRESFFPYLSLGFAIFLVLSLKTGLYSKIFKDWGGSFALFLQEEVLENLYARKGKKSSVPVEEVGATETQHEDQSVEQESSVK